VASAAYREIEALPSVCILRVPGADADGVLTTWGTAAESAAFLCAGVRGLFAGDCLELVLAV